MSVETSLTLIALSVVAVLGLIGLTIALWLLGIVKLAVRQYRSEEQLKRFAEWVNQDRETNWQLRRQAERGRAGGPEVPYEPPPSPEPPRW